MQSKCITIMNTQVTERRRKSEKLTGMELRSLKAFRKKFDTEVDCAVAIGIDRVVLNRILLKGSASPDTIIKIREALAA